MAVPRPGPRDDADAPASEPATETRISEVSAAATADPDDPTLTGLSRSEVMESGDDTEAYYTLYGNDRAGWHVRLVRLPRVLPALDRAGCLGHGRRGSVLSAIILLAARIGGGAGAGAISLVMAARIVPGFFFGPLAGCSSDRWDRKKVMVSCDIGRAIRAGHAALRRRCHRAGAGIAGARGADTAVGFGQVFRGPQSGAP